MRAYTSRRRDYRKLALACLAVTELAVLFASVLRMSQCILRITVVVALLLAIPASAQGFSAKINFQTNGPTLAPGYLADVGLLYGDRGNGFTYGWLVDNTSAMHDLSGTNTVDFRYATYAQFASNNVWQIAVPNGAYTIHLVAGSVSLLDGVYRFAVQGSPADA